MDLRDLSTARNALATVVLALTGVLLIAAGFFAAIIVLDNRRRGNARHRR